ncbi:MAG TPA: pyruvate kinase [Thermomicrobiaceae bacterium]|nr:pyruvate kinase [Thermomicrobiaceae bacterium]
MSAVDLAHRRHTKIVATIGPATWDLATLEQVIRAGANVLRINAAHNDIETRWRIVRTARQAARETGCRIALLQDLAGLKPRTGPLPSGQTVALERGQAVELVAGDEPLRPGRITIEDAPLVAQLAPGQRVLMADGLLELVVEERRGDEVLARVVRGGRLRGRQGVTVPGAAAPPRVITPQEADDIAFAAEAELEYLGVSFVTKGADIEQVRQELRRHGGHAGIVAKIERPEALAAIHEIAHESDALMVARGDLGVQLPPEEVPFAQKQIIDVARRHGVPVITATQMLESMITQPIPTRAETSDVANAVLDGTDAVMLSAETATGEFPVEAVEMMDRIVCATEAHFPPRTTNAAEGPITVASTIARAATDIARRSPLVNLIAVLTRSGFSAREVARERPVVPIVALTNSEFVANQLTLVWGVSSLVAPFADTTEALFQEMTERLLSAGRAKPGQGILFVGSLTVYHEPGHTNLLHLRQV